MRRSIRATDNHPMLVLRDERKPGRQRARYARRWVTVGEIKPGDFIAVPRRVPDFGEAAELPTVAGLGHAGDELGRSDVAAGSVRRRRQPASIRSKTYRVQFAIPAADVELRAELTRAVKDLFGLRCIEADEYRVVVNSKALTEWIVELGFGGLALTKRVPEWVYSLPVDQRLAFLGGWVDADGYVQPERSGSVMLDVRQRDPDRPGARAGRAFWTAGGWPVGIYTALLPRAGADTDCVAAGHFWRVRTTWLPKPQADGSVRASRILPLVERSARHHHPCALQRVARFRAGQVDRAVRRRTRVRHRSRRSTQLRRRGPGGAQFRGRLPLHPRGPGEAGRPLPGHRHRAAGAPGDVQAVLRHRDPGRGQQVLRAEHRCVVGRLVHLRAEGRARRHPAAGLLPDQHREHGPVRADADHRRRGLLRALRRGLSAGR